VFTARYGLNLNGVQDLFGLTFLPNHLFWRHVSHVRCVVT
jgi:hypothetical protein